VVRVTTALEETAPFWYMLSAFPILGILIADVLQSYRSRGLTLPTIELGCQILLIIFISTFRLGIRLPISGHSLLTSFLIIRRLLSGQTKGNIAHFEMALAITVLGMLTYIKIVWWRDPITLGAGCLLGYLLVLVGRVVSKEQSSIV
jgi:hypothetical protein